MDENVIFNKSQSPSDPPPAVTEPAPLTPPASSPGQPAEPVTDAYASPPPPPTVTTPSGESVLPKPPPASPIGGILKVVGILVAVLFVIILIFFVIVPLFRGKEKVENVTLTYWGLFEEKGVMDTILNDFHRQHPTITVNYVRKDIKEYRQSLTAQLSNGNGPDIYRYHNSWVGMMSPYLSPLTADVIKPDEFKKNYFPVVQQDLVKNGALYGIPLGIDTLSLFINTELFDAAGTSVPNTWDEFVQVSKTLVVKDTDGKIKTAGAGLGTYDNINHAPDIIALLMALNGTNFTKFSETKENATQALDFYTAFAQDQGSVWDATLDPSLIAFTKGNLAMYFGYSWDIFTIRAINPDLTFSVHKVPNLSGRKVAMASYWVEGVSAKSKHQKEAMLLMQYLSQKETLQKLYSETTKTRAFGEIYPRSDLAQTLRSDPLLAPFIEQAAYATSSYFMGDTYDDGINTQMNAYLGNAVRSIQGSSSVSTAVDTLAQGVQQVLQKYGR